MITSSNSTQARRTGRQEPRVSIVPEYAKSYGAGACTLAEHYASALMPWQADVMEAWLARDEFDRPIAITIGLCVPRQNGKNYIIEIFELFVAVVLGWHVLHTAHEVKTAMKAFNRVCSYFSGITAKPELEALVQSIRRTNGQECITLKNGGCIEFSARSRQAARGFDDIQVVIFDEAQELIPEQLDAILATLSASSTGTRQIIYTGTPTPPTSSGTVFAKVREQALTGQMDDCIWHEWSAEQCPPLTASFDTLLDLVYETNPSMGITLDEKFTAQEFATQTIDGFARERLGWWVSVVQAHLIIKDDWDRCALDEDDIPTMDDEKYAFGVKFAPDGSSAALSVATLYPDGTRPHIELIDVRGGRDGVSWIADWIEEHKKICSLVVIDGLYGRDVLVDALKGRISKSAISCPSATEVATAASMLKERIDTRRVSWFKEQERLNSSALNAERRAIGNRGAWGFGGSDPCPIESCSLALWGVLTTKRNAKRKLRVK